MEITTITSKYLFEVNAYLIKTESGNVLIDAGVSKKRAQFEKDLRETGCQPGELKLIILTHGHLDHLGNAAYLKDIYGAKIAMHRGDFNMVESGDMFVDTEGGFMVGLVSFLMKILGLRGYEKFTPDLYLEDNQDLNTYGLDATVIHFPGHSKGSIGVLTANGSFFCGDLLVNNGKPEKNTLIDNQIEYEVSIEKIKILKISTIYPGHGKPFTFKQWLDI